MVVKIQNSYGSMRHTLDYNEDKVKNKTASRIALINIPENSEESIWRNFNELEVKNIRTEKVSFQMSVNPNLEAGENFSDEEITEMTKKIMSHLGYDNQPMVLYRHNDIGREHYHLVSIRVNQEGKKIRDFKEGIKTNKYLHKLSKEYGFTVGEITDTNKERETEVLPVTKPTVFQQGQQDITNHYLEAYRAALRYRFKTLTQLKAIMQWYGVKLEKISPGIICLQGADKYGEGISTRLSEKEIGLQLMKEVEAVISQNCNDKSRHLSERKELKKNIDKCLISSSDYKEFSDKLEAYGIGILMSRSRDGEIFGSTVVDHKRLTAYKGTEISNLISASILKKLDHNGWKCHEIPELQNYSEVIEKKSVKEENEVSYVGQHEQNPSDTVNAGEIIEEVIDIITLETPGTPSGNANSDAERNKRKEIKKKKFKTSK